MMKKKSFLLSDLVLVARFFRAPGEPDLRIGDIVYLNSGSPQLTVVDFEASMVTVSWRDGNNIVHEHTAPDPCFHRVTPWG
jgi:uncharacterized protein YodC (DUF2158 family)